MTLNAMKYFTKYNLLFKALLYVFQTSDKMHICAIVVKYLNFHLLLLCDVILMNVCTSGYAFFAHWWTFTYSQAFSRFSPTWSPKSHANQKNYYLQWGSLFQLSLSNYKYNYISTQFYSGYFYFYSNKHNIEKTLLEILDIFFSFYTSQQDEHVLSLARISSNTKRKILCRIPF